MLRKMRPPLKNPLPRAKLSVSAVSLRRKCTDFRPAEYLLRTMMHLHKCATGGVHRGGGAPRSESIIYVIAGGNHSTIPYLTRGSAALTPPLWRFFRPFLAETRNGPAGGNCNSEHTVSLDFRGLDSIIEEETMKKERFAHVLPHDRGRSGT